MVKYSEVAQSEMRVAIKFGLLRAIHEGSEAMKGEPRHKIRDVEQAQPVRKQVEAFCFRSMSRK